MKRSSGVLLHITSLPNEYGLGKFSSEAYEFVDWLVLAGFSSWQILPLGHCDYGGSPYSAYSAFAGNPYLIDLSEFLNKRQLIAYGLTKQNLSKQEMQQNHDRALHAIYNKEIENTNLTTFIKTHKSWVHSYAAFMTIKEINNGAPFSKFSATQKQFSQELLEELQQTNAETLTYYYFVQYLFFKQWNKLKKYANKKGISIIGDMPIYVGYDSADVFANPNQFLLNEKYQPTVVGGVPADTFNDLGQNWQTPVYNFKQMKQNNYAWWHSRVKHYEQFYDVLRLDHFIGYVRYWGIYGTNAPATSGKYFKAPSTKLLKGFAINSTLTFIAEDLGNLTAKVARVRKKCGFAGMKLAQYSFDNNGWDNSISKYPKHCVAYIGTHDNSPFTTFNQKMKRSAKQRMLSYLNLQQGATSVEITEKMIETLLQAKPNLVVLRTQDMLHQTSKYRMNKPGMVSKYNWIYQLQPNQLTPELAQTYLQRNQNTNRI